MTTPRPWAIGVSALCQHRPRCANIWEVAGQSDVTFPCSGLSIEDAGLIVGAVNALAHSHEGIDGILAALGEEWRRLAQLAADARAAQGKDGDT